MTARRAPLVVAAALVIAGLVPLAARGEEPLPVDRQYRLHLPDEPRQAHRPLVVYLHGCNQTAEQAAAATGFDELADRLGFVVAYPMQNVTAPFSAPLADGNGAGCWNWFLPDHQHRNAGEPHAIAEITREVIREQRIDHRRVYIAGVSAGADMAVTMAATYPDLYAAGAVLAGCAYATCSDASGALAYEAMKKGGPDSGPRVVPLFVAQGTADHLNSVAMAETLVQGWLGTMDWADDGAQGSIARRGTMNHHGFEQSPQPGSGEACPPPDTKWPCAGGVVGFEKSYPYTVEQYVDADGCRILEFWLIHGLGHAQPAGPQKQPWTDPLGPDVTGPMYDFLSRHSQKGPCRA